MCEIENDDTLGSYGKSHDIYVYREGAGAGPHVGEIERGEGAQGDKVCLFAVGVVCEVSVREPHN